MKSTVRSAARAMAWTALASVAGALAGAVVLGSSGVLESSVRSVALGALCSSLGFAVAALSLRRGRPVRRALARGAGPRVFLLTTIAALALSTGASSLASALGVGSIPTLDEIVALLSGPLDLGERVILLMTLALGPALGEELFFRGLILESVPPRGRSGLWISAGVFGLVHVHPVHILAAGALGVLLGWVAARTRSVWPGIVAHLTVNAVFVLSAPLGEPPEPLAWAGISGLVFFMAWWSLRRQNGLGPLHSPGALQRRR